METTYADSWSDMVLYFTVQWFCFISWRLFDVCTSFFWSVNQYDPMFDPKINVDHCDLYFMVQWFCLISWRLSDECTSYFGIMNQYDPRFDLKVNVDRFDLYFMVQWPIRNYESVWHDVDLKINVGHCDLYFMVHWFCVISWRLF